MTLPVVVIGAGISGLAAAHRLLREGREVVVLERTSRAGGVIHTEHTDGYRLEWGPHSILASAHPVYDLLEELGHGALTEAAAPEGRSRFILRKGRLRRAPFGPLSWRAVLRALREPFVRPQPGPDETIDAFVRRRFGAEVADYLVAPFVSGVYAGRSDEIELGAALPLLEELERDAGSVIRGLWRRRRSRSKSTSGRRGTYTIAGGMDQLPRLLAESLGDGMRFGVTVEALEPTASGWCVHGQNVDGAVRVDAGAVICAVPSPVAAGLVRPHAAEAAKHLEAIPQAGIAVAQAGVKRSDLVRPPRGFGFLVPRLEKCDILGCIFSSCIFPDRAPADGQLFSVFLGGRNRPDLLERSEKELGEMAVDSLGDILGERLTPQLVDTWKIDPAIPQYTVGHRDRIAAIRCDILSVSGLELAGNYLEGVAIPKCIESGEGAARALLATP